MIINLLIFLSSISLVLFALTMENPCSIMFPRGGDEDWGNGAYHIPDADSFEVNIYRNTKGELFGVLKNERSYLQLLNKEGKPVSFMREDVEWIGGYTNEYLKVKDSKHSAYVEVLWKSFEGGAFINKLDLERAKAKYSTYKDLLFIKDRIISGLGVNLEKSCLNLREQPSVNSAKILCIPGNNYYNQERYTDLKILDFKDDWAKVEVISYIYDAEFDTSGEGCGFSENCKYTGWVKAIDDSGFPNIWYPVTAY